MITEKQNIKLPEHILIQLYTRFLLNLPTELKAKCDRNFVRLFFEIERAHWFYLDNYITDPTVGGLDMFGFTEQLFKQFPNLVPKGVNWKEKYVDWRRYRGETETGGAIILDENFEMILLVQGFHRNRWNFPGGKVNENESLVDCAAREVLEETGLDIEYRIVPSLQIDRVIGGTLRRAFIVENMPRMSRLQPGTQNEIEAITWFNVKDLPAHIQDSRPVDKFNMRPNSFYLIIPYMKQLQEYIKLRRRGLPELSALEQSHRSIYTDHQTTIPGSMNPSNETKSSTRDRIPSNSKSPLTRPMKITQDQPVLKWASHASSKTKRLSPPLDLNEFRKDLLLFHVSRPTTTSASNTEFSASCWANVRLRGDVLTDLLS